MQNEILKVEKDLTQAIINNDAEAIGGYLADDWIIVDPYGSIVDKARFLGVVKSGGLIHESMDSEEVRVRVYGDAATVTALTTTKGNFMGHDFTSQERATDVFVKKNGKWQCVVSHLTRIRKKQD